MIVLELEEALHESRRPVLPSRGSDDYDDDDEDYYDDWKYHTQTTPGREVAGVAQEKKRGSGNN